MFQTAAGAAAATDGTQIQLAQANIKLMMTDDEARSGGLNYRPGFRMRGVFFAENPAVMDLFFGLAVVDTSIIASEPTDYLGLYKVVADTAFSAKGRKASGTAVAKTLSHAAFVTNQFISVDMTFIRTGTGMGNVEVAMGYNVDPGKPWDAANNNKVTFTSANAAFPDTVLVGPSVAWRVGTAASQPKFGVCYMGWEFIR
jgi:hypothetical protein